MSFGSDASELKALTCYLPGRDPRALPALLCLYLSMVAMYILGSAVR